MTIELESAKKKHRKQKENTPKKTRCRLLCLHVYVPRFVFLVSSLYSMALAFCPLDWVHMAFNRLYPLYSLITSFFLSTIYFVIFLLATSLLYSNMRKLVY